MLSSPGSTAVAARPATPSRTWGIASVIAYEAFQIALGALIAWFPWAYVLGYVETEYAQPRLEPWLILVGAMGVQALCMLVRMPRNWITPALSLALIGGLCFIQVAIVYGNIVSGAIQKDYALLAASISEQSDALFTNPLDRAQRTWLNGYFDPFAPLFDRLFNLADDPFRLLGFQLVAMLSAPVAIWVIALLHPRLRPFQALVPTVLLLHPSLPATLQADYHTSAIGITFWIVGSYLFWLRRKRAAFALLLIAAFTKISYWPSWLVFGGIHALRREWRWAVLYGVIGAGAMGAYIAIQPPAGELTPVGLFFGQLGKEPGEAAFSIFSKTWLWIKPLFDPVRWQFLVLLLLPLGFAVFRYPQALLPAAPLVAFTMLDYSYVRSMVFNVYASEYLGFALAAILLGLRVAGKRLQGAMAVAMCLGMAATLFNLHGWIDWRPVEVATKQPVTIDHGHALHATEADRFIAEHYRALYWRASYNSANALSPEYNRAVAFTTCALGSAPTVVTSYYWMSYVRGQWDRVFIDEAMEPIEPYVWDTAETLVYPVTPLIYGSLVNYPKLEWPYDLKKYGALLDRMPYTVTIPTPVPWRYHGGQRLAECAAEYDYDLSRTTMGSYMLPPATP